MTDLHEPLAIDPPKWGADLAAAFAAAQAEMPDITKGRTANVPTKTGGSYSYTYADLNDVLTAIRPVLARHNLFISQDVIRRAQMIDTYTTLGHKSGQFITFGPMSFEAGGTPQSAGSAVTYARRYSLLAAVGLATEDDDGQHAAQAPKAPRRAAQDAPSEPPELAGYNGGRVSATGITAPQVQKLSILLNEHGLVEKAAVIAYVSDKIGRTVGSRKELSKAEAAVVISALEAEPVPS